MPTLEWGLQQTCPAPMPPMSSTRPATTIHGHHGHMPQQPPPPTWHKKCQQINKMDHRCTDAEVPSTATTNTNNSMGFKPCSSATTTTAFHNSQLWSAARSSQKLKKTTVRSAHQSKLGLNFWTQWLWIVYFRPPAGAGKLSDYQTWKDWIP